MTLPALDSLRENSELFATLRESETLHVPTRIRDLTARDFRGLEFLKSLTIGPEREEMGLFGTVYTPLVPGIFSSLKNLRELHIVMKGVTNLKCGAFAGLDSLEVLNLAGNRIARIEPGAFAELPRLTTLYLDHNQLTHLSRDTFRELGGLLTLRLNSNRLVHIAPDAFSDLRELVTLDLSDNALLQGLPIELPSLARLNVGGYQLNPSFDAN